jgi:methionyl-tRNA formyltransferase
MRVIFLGTPKFAVPSLQALIRGAFEVCAVYTQPDRPAGRGHNPQQSAVKTSARDAGIPVFQPEKIRAIENRLLLESFRADALVVVAYGQILPVWMLELPPLGCVNIHGSLLPRYRGAAPVAWAILNGDRVSGVTSMLMDEHMDTGPMLLKKEVDVPETMTAGQLADTLAEAGAGLLIPTLEGLRDGTITPLPQNSELATLAPKITKEMAPIRWDRDARSIHNQIRGLNPWPLASAEYLDQRLQILKSSPSENGDSGSSAPGTLLAVTDHGMKIACGSGSVLEILELQPAGKRRMSGRDFANGFRLKPGQARFTHA